MIGIPLALLWSNAGEWWIHKHVLHALGKVPRSFWSFHWHEHHKNARRHGHRDPTYERDLLGWHVHYHRVHKRAHLDPAWAREHLAWHFDHHMGRTQDAN